MSVTKLFVKAFLCPSFDVFVCVCLYLCIISYFMSHLTKKYLIYKKKSHLLGLSVSIKQFYFLVRLVRICQLCCQCPPLIFRYQYPIYFLFIFIPFYNTSLLNIRLHFSLIPLRFTWINSQILLYIFDIVLIIYVQKY